MPVETSGDMILLANVYTKATGDTQWLQKYMGLFQQWAEYLAANSLYPACQLLTTDAAGRVCNSTELAIKGAVALVAFGNLSKMSNYTDIGMSNAMTISSSLGATANTPHLLLTYNNQQNWTLGYNLFADKILGLNVFPQSVYDVQSAWYPTVRETIGVPLQSGISWGKTDWNSWCAAFSSPTTRDMFITDIHAYVSNGLNTAPLSDRFYVVGNKAGHLANGVKDRPTVGGHFAPLLRTKVASASSLWAARGLLCIIIAWALAFHLAAI